MSQQSVSDMVTILENDLQRASPETRMYYRSIVKRFLRESGDFSRSGMLTWLNNAGYCDNSIRTIYYVLERLCTATGNKFPLDTKILPPKPDEEDIHTPTMKVDEIKQLITFWKRFAGSYTTALVFASTIYGFRSVEMTSLEIDVDNNQMTVHVAKRKRPVTRIHVIPEGKEIYLAGYEQLSEESVRHAFRKACKKAGVHRDNDQNWHSVRRALDTTCLINGIDYLLVKRFMRWAKNNREMTQTYFHLDFEDINKIMFGLIPIPGSDPPVYIKHPFIRMWD